MSEHCVICGEDTFWGGDKCEDCWRKAVLEKGEYWDDDGGFLIDWDSEEEDEELELSADAIGIGCVVKDRMLAWDFSKGLKRICGC